MKECVCEEKVQYAYASNPGLPLRKPEQPRAGHIFIGWSIFFIGFHDFTCACARFSGFCWFIGLSDFSLRKGLAADDQEWESLDCVNV